MRKQDLRQSPSFQAASPASPSPPPGGGGALRMNATCGRKCAGLLPSCGPVGCLGKMLLASSIWGSTKRFLTWQKRDTLFSHSYFRLAASAHGMSASELLSSRLMFPTPLASDKNTGRDARNLDVFLSDNGIFRKKNRNGTIWSLPLSAAVFYLTPVASDGFRSVLKPSAFDPKKKDGNLSAQIISQEQPMSDAAAPVVCSCTEKCAAGAVNTSCPVCMKSMVECVGKEPAFTEPDEAEPEQEPQEEKGDSAA